EDHAGKSRIKKAGAKHEEQIHRETPDIVIHCINRFDEQSDRLRHFRFPQAPCSVLLGSIAFAISFSMTASFSAHAACVVPSAISLLRSSIITQGALRGRACRSRV